jgi:hypothetical protein
MSDPRLIAMSILGSIDWQTEVSGFCRCPGEAYHTSANGRKDCRVNVDGAPTIFCFHASCAPAVAEANGRLRRELGAAPWELRLPDGGVLRSGDLLREDGTVLRAVFAYLRRRLHYDLHCIVDTAGKSLHGWFDAPRSKVLENRLKAGLVVFGCDPKVFTYSQPVRVPGAWREGRLQRLIWLRE